MRKITEFHCEPENLDGRQKEDALKAGCVFPEAYIQQEKMIKLAKFYKKSSGDVFCEMPFCHTLEAEALGADIRLGDGTTPPRVGKYCCETVEELLALPQMQLESGRMGETLRACRELTQNGEKVVFNLSGPLTICNSLIDIRTIFKAFRKCPEQMKKLLDKFCQEELRVIAAAEEAGVRWFSYADSAGAVSMIGPKLMEQLTETFTMPFLIQACRQMHRDSMMILCPKTTFALLGTDLGTLRDVKLPEVMTYHEACARMAGTVKIAGQMCMKRREYQLKNQILKEIVLTRRED